MKTTKSQFNSILRGIPMVKVEMAAFPGFCPKPYYPAERGTVYVDDCRDFVVIDTETTGLDYNSDKIISLSAIRFRDGCPIEGWSTLINPLRPIPAEASEINQIYDSHVVGAPTLSQVAMSFLAFVGKDTVVGYNVEFDLSMLRTNGIDLETLLPDTCVLDVYPLARNAYLGLKNYKLDTVAGYIGIQRYDSHESLSDCLATGMVLMSVLNAAKRNSVVEAVSNNSKLVCRTGSKPNTKTGKILVGTNYTVSFFVVYAILYVPIVILMVAVRGLVCAGTVWTTIAITVAASIIAQIFAAKLMRRIEMRVKRLSYKLSTVGKKKQ